VGYLGAQVPTAHLVRQIHRTGSSVVCLSAALSTRLPIAHAAITAVQATGAPVMAGGPGFGVDGRRHRRLRPDTAAQAAPAAPDRLEAGPLPTPRPPHQAVDDLPHLADQKYTMVTRAAHGLVRGTMERLEQRFPPMRDYDQDQRERTAE